MPLEEDLHYLICSHENKIEKRLIALGYKPNGTNEGIQHIGLDEMVDMMYEELKAMQVVLGVARRQKQTEYEKSIESQKIKQKKKYSQFAFKK